MNKNRKRVAVKQEMQNRAEDLKSIAEQRAELVEKLEALTQQADTEQRAFTEEEEKDFDETESAIKKLDDTLKRMERARDIPLNATETKKKEEKSDDPEALEERAFAAYVRGEVLEERADVNMTTGDNGAVIPSSIANKIIKRYMTFLQSFSWQKNIMFPVTCLFRITMKAHSRLRWLMLQNLRILRAHPVSLPALN